ncbi:MAG: anti-sigma factor antagonist [Planctomycetota bacterium]|nr:MAG: anti-sigma factor antagonist [Planctomycetota bacterium]
MATNATRIGVHSRRGQIMSDTVTRVEPHEQIVLVHVERRALDEQATSKLEWEVSQAAASQPGAPVVLDFEKVTFVPSNALGALVNLRNGLNLEGRPLILVNLSRRVHGTIRVTRLDQILKVYPTLDDALRHLAAE